VDEYEREIVALGKALIDVEGSGPAKLDALNAQPRGERDA
jgi:hypothetical protein